MLNGAFRDPRESEGGRCDAPSAPSGGRVLASELAETLSPDGPSTCRRQARALRFPSNRHPARSASAGAISVDSRRPRRLALRVPHARDLPSSCPRCLVAPASHQRPPQAASVVPQKDLLEHPPQAARPVPVPPRRMSRKRNKLPVACPRDSGILAAHQLGGPCRIGPSGHRETGGTGSLPGQDMPEGRRPGPNPQVSGQGKRSLRVARLLLDPPRVTGTRQPGAPPQQQQNKKNQTNSLNQKTKP
jgi:hypothetical protein